MASSQRRIKIYSEDEEEEYEIHRRRFEEDRGNAEHGSEEKDENGMDVTVEVPEVAFVGAQMSVNRV